MELLRGAGDSDEEEGMAMGREEVLLFVFVRDGGLGGEEKEAWELASSRGAQCSKG